MPQCNSARLVVVDDEPEICAMIDDYLGGNGYAVRRCANGVELDAEMAARSPDLIILDVAMPGEDGVSIARRLRATGSTPIIMLTAMDDVVDRIVGLEVGADDYLTKPFDLRELRARVRAMLRRAAREPAVKLDTASLSETRDLVPFGKMFLDLEARVLVDRQGDRAHLTATEFNLLMAFARNPNRVLSRDCLLDTAPCGDRDPFDRAIDIRVTRIRKKTEVDPSKPQVIRTVRGVGYMYVPPRAMP